ncbi:outer membrane protein OmpK [Pontibacter sp. 13R65]|uniref:outer membrane protein OmpK n=1 Tax=Pontibacter sp. 13R65 TaxID=3127458 RepID=UPI00301D17E0
MFQRNSLSSLLCSQFLGFRLVVAFLILIAGQAAAQVNYKGGSNVQLLYGHSLQGSGKLATITLEHFGDYGAFEHFGFADLFNNASLAGPDLYLEWYPKISLSRALGTSLQFGPLRDVLIGSGINVLFGGNEDFFASVVGPVFKFKVPGSGLVQLETYYYRQNGAEFQGTYQITPSWDIPLPLSETVRFRFRGFMDFIGDRGPGTTQYLTQPQFFIDAGSLRGKPGRVYVGSEWRYWKNVVGIAGLEESILQANILFSL